MMAQSDLYMLYHGLYLPKFGYTTESLKYFESFQVQDDDIFIISYPKSGTTWMQEILSLILSEGDLTPVLTLQSFKRIPWLEAKRNDHLVSRLKSPRAFISHMPYQLMPSTFFSSKAKVQDDDTFIITYPKSGTTWIQEIISLILSEGDLTPVLTLQGFERIPWLEAKQNDQLVSRLKSPRAFMSHMPYQLMPSTFFSSKAKVIYLARNPKDVVVSQFYFQQTISFLHDPGMFEDFTDDFLGGNVMFGKWTDHVKSWRNADLGDRILYITYEEMLQDLRGVIERILRFLNRQLSEEALKQVIEQSQFKAMKQNKMSNSSPLSQKITDNMRPPFLRKGIAGDWKNHFSPELETKFNAVISEELKGTNILFPWDEEHK